MRTDAHRTEPNLKVRQRLALKPVHRHHRERDAGENDQHIDQRPELIPGLARGHRAPEIGHDEVRHQRSTSPSTMSIVPMTAITSATSRPRTMMSSACKLTNDGGRTRTR